MTDTSQPGLTAEQAQTLLKKFGPNQIAKISQVKFWAIAKEEVTEPMILLLLVVGIFYSVWGKLEDALTIFVVIFLLVLAEVWNEYRAKKAISALSQLASPKAKVMRDGKIVDIKAELIVPGDIIVLASGTRVPADANLIQEYSIETDESTLTGEALPVEKNVNDQIFAGTLVVSGEGLGQVTATGINTKFGKIASEAQIIKEPKTALQLAMKDLSKKLVWLALFFSITIPVLGILRGLDFRQMVLTGLSLAFATIPEELPIIITMVLGLGAYQLSKKNFLVKKIKAAEELGNATVILTDKTGTLTQNKLKIVDIFPTEHKTEILQAALGAITTIAPNFIDQTIVTYAQEQKMAQNTETILRERSFGDGRKTKSIIRKINGTYQLFMSGSPEEIIPICQFDHQAEIEKMLESETAKGRRVIAVGQKSISESELKLPWSELEKNLSFGGLISLEDSPRPGVKKTILQAKAAGIRTIMVTGDHPATAGYIAQSVGIISPKVIIGSELDAMSDQELQEQVKTVSVFARTSPEHKYRLVQALQANGEIVAVTGDGVNDTLALKGADIGVAMGIKGTDAAKEAADIVLADDNYVTLADGIFEGRKFFDNLSKGVKYYLSVKIALVCIFLLPILLGLPLPFSPIQIIILELFMDLAASAGFVAEPAEANIFRRPPRDPKLKFLNRKFLQNMFLASLTLFAAVTISYLYAFYLNLPLLTCQTMALTAWMIGHILLAYVSRSDTEPLLKLKVWSNRYMNYWLLGAIVFLTLALSIHQLSIDLKLAHLHLEQFMPVLLICIILMGALEARKYFIKTFKIKN